jgi:hypothetical protein
MTQVAFFCPLSVYVFVLFLSLRAYVINGLWAGEQAYKYIKNCIIIIILFLFQ